MQKRDLIVEVSWGGINLNWFEFIIFIIDESVIFFINRLLY